MAIYKNSFFNLCVKLSEGWRLQSWSTWKNEPKNNAYMQRSDDDIPYTESESKTLFLSHRRIKGTPMLTSCQFSMHVYCTENEYDLSSLIVYRDNQISRIMKTGKLFGKETQIVTIHHDCNDYVLIQETVAWQAAPNLWLSATMVGDNSDSYEEAKSQFNKLMCVIS